MQRKTHDASGSPCFLKPFKVTAARIASSLLPLCPYLANGIHSRMYHIGYGYIESHPSIWQHRAIDFFFFTLEHQFESVTDIYCRKAKARNKDSKKDWPFVQAALDLQRNLWYAGDCFSGAAAVQQQKHTPAVQDDGLFAFLKHVVIVWRNPVANVEGTHRNQWEPCIHEMKMSRLCRWWRKLTTFSRVDELPLLKIQSDYVTLTKNIPKTIWIK